MPVPILHRILDYPRLEQEVKDLRKVNEEQFSEILKLLTKKSATEAKTTPLQDKILGVVSNFPGTTAQDIATVLTTKKDTKTSRNQASNNCKQLCDMGLLRREKEGSTFKYYVNVTGVTEKVTFVT